MLTFKESEMQARTAFLLVFAAALGSGIAAGIFYAFSSFVMAALGRLPPEQGVAAMNHINVTVITPSFMIVFMGMAVLSLLLGGASMFWWSVPGAKLVFAASVVYLLGCFGVTMAFNVPLNNQLAAVGPGQMAGLWTRYLEVWTAWNHVRTVAPLVSAALFTVALVVG
ncbi:MAG TPA: anthrone oxygenase family protein [Albitalea sp.]|uniref:anthrone oxygenase family protein n=1 Tax=Piscinibacter sp. TaxID=1903157 RepID=UPI002ED48638